MAQEMRGEVQDVCADARGMLYVALNGVQGWIPDGAFIVVGKIGEVSILRVREHLLLRGRKEIFLSCSVIHGSNPVSGDPAVIEKKFS